MIVKSIEWLSDEAQEALVNVTDGVYDCVAFCHPCTYAIGDIVSMLYAVNTIGVMVSIGSREKIRHHSTGLGVDGSGFVIDAKKGVISIGGLLIEIGEVVPKDTENGVLIDFSCSRVDLW